MENDNTTMVVVPIERYTQLILAEHSLQIFGQSVLGAGRLGYDGNFLTLSDSEVNAALKYLFPDSYAHRLNQLRAEEAAKQEAQ